MNADEWIERLGLRPHPEGGFFREVYRAAEGIAAVHLPPRFDGDRSFSTAIYYLLRSQDFGALHTVQQDELWHHYDGATLTLHIINAAGQHQTHRLGKDLAGGARPVLVIPASQLFGATVDEPDTYTLVGCTVAPGFDYRDFAMPPRADLLGRFPGHRELIERLTRVG
jgi:predicted cupin superfamily sugar epimerase